MTPNDIEVLIHCFCIRTVHPRFDAPSVQETLNTFYEDGIIEPVLDKLQQFVTTEKGNYLVNMLCDTPYPVKRFVDPRTFKNGV